MLFFVDILAVLVQFPIELSLLLPGQMSTVGGHVPSLLVENPLIVPPKPARLLRAQRSILYALLNPVVLVLQAIIYLVDSRMTRIVNARTSGLGRRLSGRGRGWTGALGGGDCQHQASRSQDDE